MMTTQTNEQLLLAALSYIGRGWAIFPCQYVEPEATCSCHKPNCDNIGKHPATPKGFKDATTEEVAVRKWWTEYPFNIGIATGPQSDLFVIDVDGPEGETSLDKLMTLHGPLPATLTARTGRGRHLYFRHPEGMIIKNSTSKLGPKIDIRGEGGYIIAPPSCHVSGIRYQWENEAVEIAFPPDWLLELLIRSEDKPLIHHGLPSVMVVPDRYVQAALEQAGDTIRQALKGTRNDTLNKESYSLGQLVGARALDYSTAESYLFESARLTGLPDREARTTIQSGLDAGMKQPRDLTHINGNQRHHISPSIQPPPNPEDRWPEPNPLPSSLPPVEAFDPNLLPETLRPWLEDIAERIQCPIDFPAVGAMVALSALVGRKIGIRPKAKDNWLVVPNLWGMLVGRPGIMKTPALQEPMKPLNSLEKSASKQYDLALEEHKLATMIEEERQKQVRKQIADALKKKNDLKEITLKQEEQDLIKPVRQRYVVNDSTVERLGEILADNPNGILLYRDELIGFLKTLERTGQEGARAFYLESWNGTGRFTYDRIGRGTIDIEAACVSVLGGIQPGPLRYYLRDTLPGGSSDDGLIQRFQLAVWPDVPNTWKNIDRWPNTEARQQAYRIYEHLAKLHPESVGAIKEAEEEIPFVRFSEEAQEIFTEWRTELEHRLRTQEEHPAMEAHLSKYRSLVPSLALLIHLIDGQVSSVGKVATLQATAWAEYLESHANRIYSTGIGSDIEAARKLLKHLQKGDLPLPFTARDVYRHGWSGLATKEAAQQALELLEEYGYIRKAQVSTGGRPREEYEVHPMFRKNNHG